MFITGLSFLAPQAWGQQPQRLLIMGDSLSAGYGLEDINKAYAQILKEKVEKSGVTLRLMNASVSGETTSGGARRLPALLKRTQPHWIILELGANDGLRGLPLDAMEANLESMMQNAQKAQAKVLLVGMQMPPNFGVAYQQGFARVFQRIAQKYSVAFMPFFLEDISENPQLMQVDRLHPNEAAQPLLAEKIYQALTQAGFFAP